MNIKKFTQKDRYGNTMTYEFEGDKKPLDPTAIMTKMMDMQVPEMEMPEMSMYEDHPGEPRGSDTVPAWLTPGEFVVNAEAMRIPGAAEQVEAINNQGRAIQQMQGGSVPEYYSHGGEVPPEVLAELQRDPSHSGPAYTQLLNAAGAGWGDEGKQRITDYLKAIGQVESGQQYDRLQGDHPEGIGRGYYQFERTGSETAGDAAQRYKNQLKKHGLENLLSEEDKKILASERPDFAALSPDAQDAAALANILSHPRTNTAGLASGEVPFADSWADTHWAGWQATNDRDLRAKKIEQFLRENPQYKAGGGDIGQDPRYHEWLRKNDPGSPELPENQAGFIPPPAAAAPLPVDVPQPEAIPHELIPNQEASVLENVGGALKKTFTPRLPSWVQFHGDVPDIPTVEDPTYTADEFGGITRDLSDGEAQITDAAVHVPPTDVELDLPPNPVAAESAVKPKVTPEEAADPEVGPGADQKGDTVDDTKLITEGEAAAEKDPGYFAQVVDQFKTEFGNIASPKNIASMALKYLGSRAFGYGHEGSLNWAARTQLQEHGAVQQKADEAALGGKYEKASIEKYRKSGDPADLQAKPVPAKRTKATPTTFYHGNKPVQAFEYTDAAGNKFLGDKAGRPLNTEALHQDAWKVKGTKEYKSYVADASRNTADVLKELKDQYGQKVPGDKTAGYKTEILPSVASGKVAEWAAKNGVGADELTSLVEGAYHDAVNDTRQDGAKVRDLTPYLNQLVIRNRIGSPDLFVTEPAEDGKPAQYVDAEKLAVVNKRVADQLRAGGFQGTDSDLFNQYYNSVVTAWSQLPQAEKDKYNNKAIEGENGFYVFLIEQAR